MKLELEERFHCLIPYMWKRYKGNGLEPYEVMPPTLGLHSISLVSSDIVEEVKLYN